MKILHVIANLSPDRGGPPKAALEMCRALARHGHTVTLYTTNAYGAGTLNVPIDRPVLVDGVSVHYFPIGRFRRWSFSWPLARALHDHVRKFDVVHIHSLYIFHTFAAAHYCRKYNVPYLIRPHGSLDPFLRRKSRVKKAIYHFLIEKRNLDHAAAIHYTTHEEMELAHRPVGIRAPGVVVPLGLNLDDYAVLPPRGTLRARFPQIGDKFIVLFLGRINFKKGLDLLARAYGEVACRREDVHLVIAGPEDEGYGRQVRAWIEEKDLLDRVTFTGMLLGQDKLAAFRDADVFVLPSYAENFGIAVIEAMACGLPVIISDQVNICREIAVAEAGIVVNCSVESLANGIHRVLDDPNLAERLGKNGYELVKQKFTWDTALGHLIPIYRKLTLNQ